jgi:PsbP-like protein
LQQKSFGQTSLPLDQSYKNTLCGIAIKYPSGWVTEESNKKFSSGKAELIDMATIKPDTIDGFKTTVDLEANSMSSFLDKSIQGIGNDMKDYILLSPEASIEGSQVTEINGHPAYKIVYTQGHSSSPEVWKIMEVYIIDGTTEYTIRFTGTDLEHYDKYVYTFVNMINSVKMEGKKCF